MARIPGSLPNSRSTTKKLLKGVACLRSCRSRRANWWWCGVGTWCPRSASSSCPNTRSGRAPRWRKIFIWSQPSRGRAITSIIAATRTRAWTGRSPWLLCARSSRARKCALTMPCATARRAKISPVRAGRRSAGTPSQQKIGSCRSCKSATPAIFHLPCLAIRSSSRQIASPYYWQPRRRKRSKEYLSAAAADCLRS